MDSGRRNNPGLVNSTCQVLVGKWIPRWLAPSYQLLLTAFGSALFTSEQASTVGVRKPEVVLPRLEKAGWLHRQGRGLYSAADPRVAMLCSFREDWRPKLRQKEYVPLVESALGSPLAGYGERLRGAVLYGPVARGTAGETGDVLRRELSRPSAPV